MDQTDQGPGILQGPEGRNSLSDLCPLVRNGSVRGFRHLGGIGGTDNDDPDDDDDPDDTDEKAPVAITWNKTKKANHGAIREAAADKIGRAIKCRFKKTSPSRYVSDDNECALFVLSATYSQKNSEYWYSIDDENIPWMKLYPTCYVVFALGSADHLLVFEFGKLRQMLDGCLKTREDPEKKKKAHFHIAFSVEESRVYFKKKRPEREFIEVTEYLK